MQFVDFHPGVADLDPAAAEKGKSLIKVLNERPQIKIEIPIAWVNELDRPALVEAQFLKQIQEAQSGGTRRKNSAAPAAGFEQLDSAAKLELLTQLYSKDLGGAPTYPEDVTSIKTKPELAAAKIDFLTQAVHAHISVNDADLTALGQQRATAIQQVLLTDTQVDPARVFLVANDKAQNKDGQVRLELSLK